ncbi:hypothetical protein J4421_03795 [Candidatus Woesearchaeota archaeon]|nr:hypothetical protein [Candidatus Woesearchaeota archaeon]
MNKFLKRLSLGLIIWAIPLVTSFFVWDVKANAPAVSVAWFNALMSFTWAIGFVIAAFFWFKNIEQDAVKEGLTTGITWYLEAVILDLIVLVGAFGMTITDFYPLLLTYLGTVVMSVGIGYIIRK